MKLGDFAPWVLEHEGVEFAAGPWALLEEDGAAPASPTQNQ